MSNVHEFPTKSVRDWLMIEREMKTILQEARAPSAAQERLLETMKEFYAFLDIQLDFSVAVEFPTALSPGEGQRFLSHVSQKVGDAFGTQIQAFTNKLFFDRLTREIEVCHELGLL